MSCPDGADRKMIRGISLKSKRLGLRVFVGLHPIADQELVGE